MRRIVGSLVALLIAPLMIVGGPAARADEPVRILIYGDSITQGSSGDYTWRYFLDRHLHASGVPFGFVGPRTGLYHLSTPGDGGSSDDDQAYAVPGFDTHSGAVWGQTLAIPQHELVGLVTDLHPDLVVALIGLNDLNFLRWTPDQVADLWRTKIADARDVDPGVDVVLVQVPDVWYVNVPAYNERLVSLATELDSPDDGSRVVTTALPAFDKAVDTWDGTHPTATGDVKIAQAVEDALSRIDIGAPAGAPPAVANGPVRPTSLSVTAGVQQASLTWLPVPGVTAEWLESRDATVGAPWVRDPEPAPAGELSRTVAGLVSGHRYEFRLRPAKGTAISADVTSPVVTVVPLPQRPGPVTRVKARSPRRDRVRTTAGVVPFATAYRLLVAPARSCVHTPRAGAFRRAGRDRQAPAATVRTRSRALWVRWYAVRDGVPGRLVGRSTTCTRVR